MRINLASMIRIKNYPTQYRAINITRKSMNKHIVFLLSLLLIGCVTQPSDKAESNDIDMRSIMTGLKGVVPQTPDQSELEKYPLGSKENPIRVDGPAGQRDYISRLICINGESVSNAERLGSAGIGPYGFMMDIYNVVCGAAESAITTTIYMDMYHRGNEENRVADGFSAIMPVMN